MKVIDANIVVVRSEADGKGRNVQLVMERTFLLSSYWRVKENPCPSLFDTGALLWSTPLLLKAKFQSQLSCHPDAKSNTNFGRLFRIQHQPDASSASSGC